jgi:hypothetical protein
MISSHRRDTSRFRQSQRVSLTSNSRVNYWEIIADNLSKTVGVGAGVATVDFCGRTIFVADAHRSEGKRFVVRADEKLTAFLELELAMRAYGELS